MCLPVDSLMIQFLGWNGTSVGRLLPVTVCFLSLCPGTGLAKDTSLDQISKIFLKDLLPPWVLGMLPKPCSSHCMVAQKDESCPKRTRVRG